MTENTRSPLDDYPVDKSGVPSDWLEVVLSDVEDNCGRDCIGIRVQTAGIVVVEMFGKKGTRTFVCPEAHYIPGRFSRIRQTGSTAGIVVHAAQG